MRFEDIEAAFARLVVDKGSLAENGHYGRDALHAAWAAFLQLAGEPVEAEVEAHGRFLRPGANEKHDLLLHESSADPMFRVVLQRRIALVDTQGVRGGHLVLELEARCPVAELDRVPRATRWGAAADGPPASAHPAIGSRDDWLGSPTGTPGRWAGNREQWAEKVVSTKSWKALEDERDIELRFRTRTETWPRLDLPATVDASEAAIEPLREAFEQVGFDPDAPASARDWWTAVSQWVTVPARSDEELNGDMLLFEASVQKSHDGPNDSRPLGFRVGVMRQFVFTGEDGEGGLEAVYLDLRYELNEDVLQLVAHNDRGWCNMETFWARGSAEDWVAAVEATPAFRAALRHTPTSLHMSYEPVG